jgi:hypothetical protein
LTLSEIVFFMAILQNLLLSTYRFTLSSPLSDSPI